MAGRKPFKPAAEHRKTAETLAGYGVTHPDICRLIINPKTGQPIDAKTLRDHFREELDRGVIKANAAVAQSLFQKATGNGQQSVTAAIWWSKTRMGWKETVQHTGPGGAAIPLRLESLTDEQLDILIGRIEKSLSGAAPRRTGETA
jgi:hypothetical protein